MGHVLLENSPSKMFFVGVISSGYEIHCTFRGRMKNVYWRDVKLMSLKSQTIAQNWPFLASTTSVHEHLALRLNSGNRNPAWTESQYITECLKGKFLKNHVFDSPRGAC